METATVMAGMVGSDPPTLANDATGLRSEALERARSESRVHDSFLPRAIHDVVGGVIK